MIQRYYLTSQNYLQGASVDNRYFITYTIYFVLLALEFFLCCFSDTSALSTSGPSGYHSLGERQPLLQENGKLKNGGVQPIYAVCFISVAFFQKFWNTLVLFVGPLITNPFLGLSIFVYVAVDPILQAVAKGSQDFKSHIIVKHPELLDHGDWSFQKHILSINNNVFVKICIQLHLISTDTKYNARDYGAILVESYLYVVYKVSIFLDPNSCDKHRIYF